MIALKHAYKTYDSDRHALRGITFDLRAAEFILLSGPSGAGKTTLFKILSAQEKLSEGQYIFQDKNVSGFSPDQVSAFRRQIGIVFQDFRLIPQQSIFDNIALPLIIRGEDKKQIQTKVKDVAEKFGLSQYLASFPDYLSGGEKQRVAIARSMVHGPQLIIADEPTGNLDRVNATTVMSIFKDLSRTQKVTVLLATHDEILLTSKGCRLITLENGNLKGDQIT